MRRSLRHAHLPEARLGIKQTILRALDLVGYMIYDYVY
jgi:hypothetical protein